MTSEFFDSKARVWSISDEKPTYRYRLAACRKDPAEMIVRRLSCHAAPSDTAVFYKELRVTLATARTLRPSQKTVKRLFEPQHGGRQRVKIFEDGDAIFEPVP